jgi:hypothetical protein
MSKITTKKCKKCGYRMAKLYKHQNKVGSPHWVPIIWYCKDCDKLGDRIRHKT